jgi:hypothetical protein
MEKAKGLKLPIEIPYKKGYYLGIESTKSYPFILRIEDNSKFGGYFATDRPRTDCSLEQSQDQLHAKIMLYKLQNYYGANSNIIKKF